MSGRRTVAAMIAAGAMSVSMSGILTASATTNASGTGIAGGECIAGWHADITSGQPSAFTVQPSPWTGDLNIGGLVQMAGSAINDGSRFSGWANSFQGNGVPPATAINSIDENTGANTTRTVTVPTEDVNGVVSTGMTLTVSATGTDARSSVTINHLTGPVGAGYYVDPAASRIKINADGATLAAALTAGLPGVEAALAGDTSPATLAFLAALQSAATAAPTAGDTVMGQPALDGEDLTQEFVTSATGGSGRYAVGTLTIDGIVTATGFVSAAALDIVSGQAVNPRTTMTSPTITLLGFPLVIEPGNGTPTLVDVSPLPASTQGAVTTALADALAAAIQLVYHANVNVMTGDVFNPSTWVGEPVDGPFFTTIIGDLPTGNPGQLGTYLAQFSGAQLSSTCTPDAVIPVDPTPTPTPTPDRTATPDPTPAPVPVPVVATPVGSA